MKIARIVLGPKPPRLVRLAAEELAAYTQQLFGHRPRLVQRAGKGGGLTVKLGAGAKGLSDQGYALRPVNRSSFVIEGGSPVAVLWAVYDLVERWGVRYELHGDILPDRAGAIRLPDKPVVCEPDLRLRSFRTFNDFALNECLWPAADYEVLLDQLAKLRFNAILFCVRPCDPFIDLRFRGARKTVAVPNFGWQPEIRSDHPGYPLFVASGDAKYGAFTNPELNHHRTSDRAQAAGRAYARKVFRMAHARGMQCLIIGQAADFDPAIRERIRALTNPRHKVKGAPIKRIRYGDWREGPDVETGRCMSVNNPVFLDAVTANIQAHIDAFPDADTFFFGSSEFGGSDADCERAWRALDRKYGLSELMDLPGLVREARRLAEETKDRAEHRLRSDIVVLYALDRVINERGLDLSRARRGATVAPASLAAELHRFLPRIFPHGMPYFANFGYVPAYIATRTDTLVNDDPDAIRHILVTSAEDDNVGMLAQLTAPALRQIIEALRKAGAHGFQTRQWMHSSLLPTFHYLAHAAWEKGWSGPRAYRHLYEPVCGSASLPHILRAFRRIERVTDRMHKEILCISFPVPRWILVFWEDWPENLSPEILDEIARNYERSADDLEKARRASRPAGRDTLLAMERHVRHGVYYCRALSEIGRARTWEAAAREAAEGPFERLDVARTEVRAHLDNAEALMRRACEVFAEGVRDRCDLGALASLNSYNLDVTAALARVARAKEEMFSCIDR